MYFYLKKPKGDTETNIDLIFYAKGEPSKNKNFKYSTRQKINPKQWNFDTRYPKLVRGASGKKNKQIALVLDNYKTLLENTINDFDRKSQPLTKTDLKLIFNKKFKHNFQSDELSYIVSDAIQTYIDNGVKNKLHSKTWTNIFRNIQKKIILFDTYKGSQTTFNDLNQLWIDKYCGFLRDFNNLVDRKKAKELKSVVTNNLNDNTLYTHIKRVIHFVEWAKENHSVKTGKLQNPISEYDVDTVHLEDEEVKMLENAVFDNDLYSIVRDLFLIGVYSGQRFSDYSVFERSDIVNTAKGQVLIKRAQKTTKNNFIPLHPRLKALLEKFDWKIPTIDSVTFNTTIKQICKEVGINKIEKKLTKVGNNKKVEHLEKWEMIGSHSARRTFITLSSEKGMPDHIIMAITGIRSTTTLLKYKRTSQDSVVDFVDRIWN